MTLYVSHTDPSADFSTITAAIQFCTNLTTPATIRLDAGVYYEKLSIQVPNLTLEGLSAEQTIIHYDDYAYDIRSDGQKRGTFRSYCVFVDAAHVTFRNLTIKNSSGSSLTCGQAIALYADGDDFSCIDCRLIGKQDTLFIGPLPPKEYEPGGFRGPKEHAPRQMTHQYYKNCYICGDVDFIFGSGMALFDHCTIHSLMRDHTATIQGYVTAASTPIHQPYGFLFKNCTLTGDCPPHSVYLGRPWREYAKTIFLQCTYENHIHPLGFDDWGKKDVHQTICFAEYQCCTTSDEKKRASFVHQLSENEAAHYLKLFDKRDR
ncbi:MAG: pectin methylesterase [Eubacterium sp.]|nr:pectin methylesterase [Eubacterium sp.]